ncbi:MULTISPECIES: hypothetical protein [unclassified Nostoc]|uniref:hypothetical protein n=1 Tax=unclassified Nostoc TaxID=2593658 RepID=UPI001DA84384|nr:hypothetical protein [Nostoc sp. JL23]MBN3879182.1 hypothetical protein [Nostoc sp. JL23]
MNHQFLAKDKIEKKKTLEKTTFLKIKIFLTLIPASLVLSSCTSSDIKTAKGFGDASNALEQLNTAVADDIYNSCTRSSTWLALGTSETRQNMRDAIKDCDTMFRPNSVRTKIAGEVIVEYVGAIGSLATEDRNTVKTEFEEIGTALQGLKVKTKNSPPFQFKQNTIDTGVNIATFLTNLFLGNFRRKNLKAAIVCTDKDIQTYSAGLASFIDELYVKALLDDEIDSITRYFGAYRSPLTDKTNLLLNSDSPEVFTSLQDTQLKRDRDMQDEISKVISKKNTGAAYVTLIQTTAAAHADLKRIFNDGKDNLSPELTAKCNKYFARNSSNIITMKTPGTDSLNQEISQSELEQIRKVAKAYNSKVMPLLAHIKQQSSSTNQD